MDFSNLSDKEILGLTIIGEARGEPIQGQVAVGCVCRNRLHVMAYKYKNYKDVCLEPMQFSCWNTNDPNRIMLEEIANKMLVGQLINDPWLKQCLLVAQGVVDWIIVDNTKGALNYMTLKQFNSDKKPSWAKNIKNASTIGNQIFFTAA